MDVVIGLPDWVVNSRTAMDWIFRGRKGITLDYVGRTNPKTGVKALYITAENAAACVTLGIIVERALSDYEEQPIVND